MTKKNLEKHEIDFNEALDSLQLVVNNMKIHGVNCPDYMYHNMLMHINNAAYILAKEVSTRGYRNRD